MKSFLSSLLGAFLVFSAVGSSVYADDSKKDIVDTAIGAGNFTTLVSLVQKAGLVDLLRTQTIKFTVFAPTDQAFSRVPKDSLEKLGADPEALKSVLLNHIGLGVYPAVLLKLGVAPKSLTGAEFRPGFDNGIFEVDFANVLIPDIYASNGVIHVIDAVIGVTENND